MKKKFLTLLLGMAALTGWAQRTPHALGLHFGAATIDLEYQYHFSQKNFLDVTAGVFNLDDGFSASALYNWNIREWSNWTPRGGTWKLWGGVGGAVGGLSCPDYDGFLFGPAADLGFGITFRGAPVTLGLDYRPVVAFVVGGNSGVVTQGFWNFGLTLTYRF